MSDKELTDEELKEALNDTMINREVNKVKGVLVESHNGKSEKKEDRENVLTSTTIP